MEAEARSKEAEDYRRKTERQIQTLEVRPSPFLHESHVDRGLYGRRLCFCFGR